MRRILKRLLNVATSASLAMIIGALFFLALEFKTNQETCTTPEKTITLTKEQCEKKSSTLTLEEHLVCIGHTVDPPAASNECTVGSDQHYIVETQRHVTVIVVLGTLLFLGIMTVNYVAFGRFALWNKEESLSHRE